MTPSASARCGVEPPERGRLAQHHARVPVGGPVGHHAADHGRALALLVDRDVVGASLAASTSRAAGCIPAS